MFQYLLRYKFMKFYLNLKLIKNFIYIYKLFNFYYISKFLVARSKFSVIPTSLIE